MSVSSLVRLDPQSARSAELSAGDALEVVDLEGGQVTDLAIFSSADCREQFSAGRTLDYNEQIYITVGAVLYSNRSTPLARIEHDDVGRHDYLLAPCSMRMFELLREMHDHPSCLANLAGALHPHGLGEDDIHATLNVFMNVRVSPDGRIDIVPPISEAGDRIVLRALANVLVGIAACSSEYTNGGRCKSIGYRILRS